MPPSPSLCHVKDSRLSIRRCLRHRLRCRDEEVPSVRLIRLCHFGLLVLGSWRCDVASLAPAVAAWTVTTRIPVANRWMSLTTVRLEAAKSNSNNNNNTNNNNNSPKQSKGNASTGTPKSNNKPKQNQRRPAFSQSVHAETTSVRTPNRVVETAVVTDSSRDTSMECSDGSSFTTSSASVELLPTIPPPPLRRNNNNNADGKLLTAHAERVKTAGRVGTKRHVNPCKVYLGNLSFQVTASMVRDWVVDIMGVPPHILLRNAGTSGSGGVHVVTNWQSGRSKGYAFCVFTEPMYATVAMDRLNNQVWFDRIVTASPGIPYLSAVHQLELHETYLRKQAARAAAAASQGDETNKVAPPIFMEEHEAIMLKRLDPDLLEGVTIVRDVQEADVDGYDDEDDDDDDDKLDHIDLSRDYEDEDDTSDSDDLLEWDTNETDSDVVLDTEPQSGVKTVLNREKRRDAAKRAPKRKKASQGFGK